MYLTKNLLLSVYAAITAEAKHFGKTFKLPDSDIEDIIGNAYHAYLAEKAMAALICRASERRQESS